MNKGSETSLSIVIPVYNEQSNISRLHSEIVQVCTENNHSFEIIIVDDGSTDKTSEIARNLSPVKYIRLRRNFGQTAAMDARIKAAVNGHPNEAIQGLNHERLYCEKRVKLHIALDPDEMRKNFIGQARGASISCKARLKYLWAQVLHSDSKGIDRKAATVSFI